MKTKWKGFFFFALVLVLAVMLCACAPNTEEPNEDEDPYDYVDSLSVRIENATGKDITKMRLRPNEDFGWIDIQLDEVLLNGSIVSVDLTGNIVVIEGWEFELTYADETVETRQLVPINQHKYIVFNETGFTFEEAADGESNTNDPGTENTDGGEQTPSGGDAE